MFSSAVNHVASRASEKVTGWLKQDGVIQCWFSISVGRAAPWVLVSQQL